MKLKARQIVPGWPRGKSTSQPYISESNDLWWWMIGRSEWCAADGYDLHWDMARNIRYHREQKQMLDWWVSQYRTLDDEFMVDLRGRKTTVLKPPKGFVLAGIV